MRVMCDACGKMRTDPESLWFPVHFGIRNTSNSRSLMVMISDDSIRRAGEKHACSEACLHELIHRWANAFAPASKAFAQSN